MGFGEDLQGIDFGDRQAPGNDRDGVADGIESRGPNDGDGNRDGIPDSQQANVTSLPGFNGTYVTLVSPAGRSFPVSTKP